MPCSKGGRSDQFQMNAWIQDWANIHAYLANRKYIPRTRADLVAIVQDIEAINRKAKAVGSVFSLSGAPDADDFVIDTRQLNRYLSQPFPAGSPFPSDRIIAGSTPPKSEPSFRSPKHDAPLLELLTRNGFPKDGHILVHVEAGIKIRQLLADLAVANLALPTMGAGGGQSIAGAVSTSTHGSDVGLHPLADFVRAVHLVGPGGQEWWVEENGGAGIAIDYQQLPDWCPDTKVIRDSDFLKSVIVGIGRFGILYSLILEVVPQYLLEERVHETNWHSARAALKNSISTGYFDSPGVFSHHLNGSPLRFWQLVVDAASGSQAWITRRWVVSNDGVLKNVHAKPDLFDFLCTHDTAAKLVATVAVMQFITILSGLANATLNEYGAIPFAGPVIATEKATPYLTLIKDLLEILATYSTLGNFLSKVVDALRKAQDSVGFGLIDDAIQKIWGSILSKQLKPDALSGKGTAAEIDGRRGPSHLILDTHDYSLDGCFSVDSSEFCFDATSSSYLEFVDDVLKHAKSVGPVMGIVSLRFTLGTTSKLGMQQFPITVCIEVALNRPGTINQSYQQAVHTSALAHGGIPHWGQEHNLHQQNVELLYKARIADWRWALSESDKLDKQTFSSAFTRSRGLERIDTLGHHRGRRYVGAITSA